MKIYELHGNFFDDKQASYIGETDQKIDIGELVKFNNKYYNCCMRDLKENSLYVRFLDYYLPRNEDDYCEDNLRCPFCGHEEIDSFELSDEDDEYICPQCGSTLKYHREIRVSYDVEVVKEKEPLEVEFKDQENENDN